MSVRIKSANSDYYILFEDFDGDTMKVEIGGGSRLGKREITGYTYGPSLIEFFDSLATDWRGWDGKREWTSLERDFLLSVTTDKQGHFTVRATINEQNLGTSEPWVLDASCIIEASQLEKLSIEIKDFINKNNE